MKQTAVDYLWNDLIEHPGNYIKVYQIAKQMEKEQRNKLIDDIDFELMMIEDYTHGEVGDAITKLRKKLK